MRDFQRDLEYIINNADIKATPEIKFQFRKYSRIENRPIDDLDLEQRSYNGLCRSNIRTIGAVVDKWTELMNIRSIGQKSLKEIKNKVLACYYDKLDEDERQQFWYDAFEGGEN